MTETTVDTSEVKYQHYNCAKQATKMITTMGKVVAFTNFKFITKDQDIIDYLNEEIARGLTIITKGELLTHEEADPMSALKKRVIEEYLAKQAETAAAPLKNMGSTAGASKVGAASSKTVPSAASSSTVAQ